MCCGDIFKWFLKLYSFIGVKSHELHLFGSSPLWAFTGGLKLPGCINAKSHWLHLVFLHCVYSNVSSLLWEYFDLQGPWQKVLTDHKKSLYTLHVDPEKSRDFIFRNPGILINWKSRDSRDPARVCRSPYPLACWPPCQHPFQPPWTPPWRQL